MSTWYVVFGLAFVFFVLVPGSGAVAVRSQWRRFRRRVREAARRPQVTYAAADGAYRFFGRLEAIEDDDVIWLNDGTISVAADVADTACYLLPPREVTPTYMRAYPEATPDRLPWSRLTSLPERTQVFVSGPLRMEGGRPVFRAENGEELLVILHEGPDEELLYQAVWTGRHRNEYWNALTPASLAVGSLALLLASYIVLRIPADRAAAVLAVSLALIPVLPLLPPGFVSFPLYRRMWRRGRYLRAERDLLRLALRQELDEAGTTRLPDGELYAVRTLGPADAERLVAAGAERLAVSVADGAQAYVAVGTPVVEKTEETGDGGVEPAGGLRRPADPMAPFMVVPGDPAALAARSERAARRFEAGGVLCLLAGAGLNFYLALLLVSRVMF